MIFFLYDSAKMIYIFHKNKFPVENLCNFIGLERFYAYFEHDKKTNNRLSNKKRSL